MRVLIALLLVLELQSSEYGEDRLAFKQFCKTIPDFTFKDEDFQSEANQAARCKITTEAPAQTDAQYLCEGQSPYRVVSSNNNKGQVECVLETDFSCDGSTETELLLADRCYAVRDNCSSPVKDSDVVYKPAYFLPGPKNMMWLLRHFSHHKIVELSTKFGTYPMQKSLKDNAWKNGSFVTSTNETSIFLRLTFSKDLSPGYAERAFDFGDFNVKKLCFRPAAPYRPYQKRQCEVFKNKFRLRTHYQNSKCAMEAATVEKDVKDVLHSCTAMGPGSYVYSTMNYRLGLALQDIMEEFQKQEGGWGPVRFTLPSITVELKHEKKAVARFLVRPPDTFQECPHISFNPFDNSLDFGKADKQHNQVQAFLKKIDIVMANYSLHFLRANIDLRDRAEFLCVSADAAKTYPKNRCREDEVIFIDITTRTKCHLFVPYPKEVASKDYDKKMNLPEADEQKYCYDEAKKRGSEDGWLGKFSHVDEVKLMVGYLRPKVITYAENTGIGGTNDDYVVLLSAFHFGYPLDMWQRSWQYRDLERNRGIEHLYVPLGAKNSDYNGTHFYNMDRNAALCGSMYIRGTGEPKYEQFKDREENGAIVTSFCNPRDHNWIDQNY